MSGPDSVLWVDGHTVRRGKGSIYAVADQPCVAEEIAQAVNSHAALVAALEGIFAAQDRKVPDGAELGHAYSKARQALAAAKEGR